MRGQIAAIKVRNFYRNARETAQAMVSASLRADPARKYAGDSALVELSYDTQGNLAHISVASATDESLAHVLDYTVNWTSIASPAQYDLPNRTMLLRVYVGRDGVIRVGVELL